ncbi:nucleolar protein,Nop52-domain-containing protein [Scleroderma yunnanense]
MSSPSPSVPPLGKYLASSEKRTRDKAVKQLAAFLSNDESNALPDVEMAKLWKGIFYCFWMSDKPLVQQALASELAELLIIITDISSSLRFLRGFWTTIVREWHGIDRLRMDKYYMLIRKFVNATFRLLIRAKWNESAIEEYHSILSNTGGPLCANDLRVPSSLAYHLADIYLEELDKALAASESSTPMPLIALLSPFISLAAQTQTSAIYKRIQDALFQPLLTVLSPPRSSNKRKRARLSEDQFTNIVSKAYKCDPSIDGSGEAMELRQAMLKTLFDVASAETTRDFNRRKMYVLYKEAVEGSDSSEG